MPDVQRAHSSWDGDTRSRDRRRTRPVENDDLQSTIGNSAVNDLVEGQGEGAGQGASLDSLWAAAGAATVSEDTPETAAPQLAAGTTYTVTEDDLEWAESATWRKIARDHGMTADHLTAFNQQVETVNAGMTDEHEIKKTPKLDAGVEIYIPSADEIAFSQISHRAASMAEAVAEWGTFKDSANMAILRTARRRASGKIGLGYGTGGDGGIFYTQNPELVGASKRRSEMINGEREYRINWGADFWKCSVFMHDVVYSAGFKPDMTDNKHYRLAGQLQWSKDYREVPVQDAKPGNTWQRFGGSGSNESHNAVLSSFVTIEEIDEEYERWSFSIIGAEDDRAGESERSHVMKKGTNENLQGKKIRFFEPKAKR